MPLARRVYYHLSSPELAVVALRINGKRPRIGKEHFVKRVRVILGSVILFKLEEMHVCYFRYFKYAFYAF